MREEGTEVTDLASVEEGILTQPENQGKESKRGLLCSPLLGNAFLFLTSSNNIFITYFWGTLGLASKSLFFSFRLFILESVQASRGWGEVEGEGERI